MDRRGRGKRGREEGIKGMGMRVGADIPRN
jgi:hypothetical protein